MRALVIAHGEPPSEHLLREYAAPAGLIVAADGGGDVALGLGITPDVVTGDLDSLTPWARARLGPGRLVLNDDASRTDLEKAIALAISRGATEVDVLGAGGRRADHAFANLSVLLRFQPHARVRVIDDLFEISAVDGAATIDAPPGTVISLVSVCRCEGVTTTGLRWNLQDHRLEFSPHGVHNEVASPPATVSVRSGQLLLFKGRFIERHR